MDWNQILDTIVSWSVDFGKRLLISLIVLIVGRLLIKWVHKLMTKSKFAERNDKTVTTVLSHFVSAALYVLLVVIIIGILGIPTASVITVIASAGVAIGLALQGALSNIAGGIMILVLRPFRVGDYVDVAGKAGTVSDVGIFYTTLTTPDHKVIIIPNGTVMANEITNTSVKDTRRVDLVFGVAYGTNVDKVRGILLEEASKHPLTLDEPAPFARLTAQGDSSLDFTVRVWVNAKDYWTVHFDLLESINNRLEAEGIEIPFNQLDVHVINQK